MYSVVLMTALATGGSTADFHHHGCFYGAYSCFGCFGGYGCYGYYGGWGGYGGYGGYGAYGFGPGIYGAGPVYGGWYGCAGCYVCHGYGYYAFGYGCFGGYGYGCYGGYGGPGYYGGCYTPYFPRLMYGDMPVMPGAQPGGAPQPAPGTGPGSQPGYGTQPGLSNPDKNGKTPNKDGTAPKDGTPAKGKGATSTRARLVVELPEDAKLFVDDTPTKSTSSRRVFVTPPLQAGQSYYYILRAEMQRNGQPISVRGRVIIRPGQEVSVSLTNPSPDATFVVRSNNGQ